MLVDCTRLWYLAFIGILYVTTLTIVAVEPVLFSPLTSQDRPAPAAVVAQGDAVARALGTSPVPLVITGTSPPHLRAARAHVRASDRSLAFSSATGRCKR